VNTSWPNKFFKYLKKVYFRNDKRVAAYIVCVFIAAGFWFLNALGKTYTEKIVVPVRYINLPNNKTLASKPPEQFELKIKAHGFTILRNRLSFMFLPLEFNVNEMTNDRMVESKKTSFAFSSRQFLNELSYQLSNDVEILAMSPDTLSFRFDQLGSKRLKVVPLVKLNLKKQFQISGDLLVRPDSVTVSGAQSTIDTLRFVYTNRIRLNDVDESVSQRVKLQHYNEVYYELGSVEVTVPIEEYTEIQQTIEVGIKNQPQTLNIKLFPSKVKATFLVGLSRYAQIHPEDFKLTVSYSDIQEGKTRLKITADTIPPYLYSFKISPEEIEYLIEDQIND